MDHPHGHMPMDDQCAMNMLWNSQIKGTCVVFPTWHIRTPTHMFLSCLAIAGICVGYAWLLRAVRVVDRVLGVRDSGGVGGIDGGGDPSEVGDDGYLALPSHSSTDHYGHGRLSLPNFSPTAAGIPTTGTDRLTRSPSPSQSFIRQRNPPYTNTPLVPLSPRTRTIRAALYALTVAISFFLMLVAMTYNTYLFSAIIIGSFIGHWLYEPAPVLATDGPVHGKGLACH